MEAVESPEMIDAIACSNTTPYPGPGGHSEEAHPSGEQRLESGTAKAANTPEAVRANPAVAILQGIVPDHSSTKRPYNNFPVLHRPLANQSRMPTGQGSNIFPSKRNEQTTAPPLPDILIQSLQAQFAAGAQYKALKTTTKECIDRLAFGKRLFDAEYALRNALLGEALEKVRGREPKEQEMAEGTMLVWSVHEAKQWQQDLAEKRNELLKSLEEARLRWCSCMGRS
jgi:hypothetical protein